MAEGKSLEAAIPKRKACNVRNQDLQKVLQFIFNLKEQEERPPNRDEQPLDKQPLNPGEEEEEEACNPATNLPSNPTDAIKKVSLL